MMQDMHEIEKGADTSVITKHLLADGGSSRELRPLTPAAEAVQSNGPEKFVCHAEAVQSNGPEKPGELVLGDGGGDSGSSSPEPPEPWTPRYVVSFSNKVTKDGAAVTFTILVGQGGLTIQVLERVYEDFVYLEHCVTTDQPCEGIIVPPLPPPPTTDAALAETASKKHMGKGSKTLLGDNFQKDRLQLQKYLELLLAHPILGRSNRLESFLTVKEAPPRAKLRKGLLSRLTDSLDGRRSAVPDCEEFFQRERVWLTRSLPAMEQFDAAFQDCIHTHHRLVLSLDQVSTAMRLCAGSSNAQQRTTDTAHLTQIISIFVHTLDNCKSDLEEEVRHTDSVTGAGVELWRKYLASESEMLLRRTHLLINYQHCNRALDRTKPNRKEAIPQYCFHSTGGYRSREAVAHSASSGRQDGQRAHAAQHMELHTSLSCDPVRYIH
ncbi:Phoxous domain [Trinorchestia longiramus]|nr:Phoxous domain [Trinorchestia longiramus]